MIYRIKNWAEYFENNRTREMKHMAWVPVPNKHDGESFRRIMREKDGIVIYGCWHLILQVASKCLRERGTMLRDDGTPMRADSIAMKTGWDTEQGIKDFQRALDFLSSPQVGWIEQLNEEGAAIPQEGAAIPQLVAKNRTEVNRSELNEKELNGTNSCPGLSGTVADMSKGKQTDDEWLAEINEKFAKLGINVAEQKIKAEAWISTKPGRLFSRRFFINWLSRCESKLQTKKPSAGNSAPLS